MMSFVDWLTQPAGRALTLALLHFLWQGAIVVLSLVAVVKVCCIQRHSVRYMCSLAALVAMAAFPIATLVWISLGRDRALFSQPFVAAEATMLLMQLARPIDGTELSASRRWVEGLQPFALAVWLAGVMFFGSRLLAGAIGVARLRRSRLPIPTELRARVERLGVRLHMDALPLVFLSKDVAEALALGLVRRVVLVPAAWATELPLDMLEAVIAHELAHLRRMDLWATLLQRIMESLFFYHPAVWWLSRRLEVERELCSDELAVAATGQPLVYAQTLEHIATGRRTDIRPALAAFLRGERNMHLLERIRNVLSPSSSQRRHWPAGLAAVGVAVCLWTLSLTLLDSLTPSVYAEEPAQDESEAKESDQNDDASDEASDVEEELHVELEFTNNEDADVDASLDAAEEPEVELEFNEVISSEIIQRKVDEAIKRALAKLEEKKAKQVEKLALEPAKAAKPAKAAMVAKAAKAAKAATAAGNAEAAEIARMHVERLAAQAHKYALRQNAEKIAQVKQLAAQAQEKALRQSAEQIENAERLVAELQLKTLRQNAKLVEKARQQELSDAQLDQRQHEISFLDKALHQRASDERFEQLAAMVKELSMQVERLQQDVSALRDQHEGGKTPSKE
jgi:beta-lactamase regulating signal transducer with metallopeptidase domain